MRAPNLIQYAFILTTPFSFNVSVIHQDKIENKLMNLSENLRSLASYTALLLSSAAAVACTCQRRDARWGWMRGWRRYQHRDSHPGTVPAHATSPVIKPCSFQWDSAGPCTPIQCVFILTTPLLFNVSVILPLQNSDTSRWNWEQIDESFWEFALTGIIYCSSSLIGGCGCAALRRRCAEMVVGLTMGLKTELAATRIQTPRLELASRHSSRTRN